MNSALSENRGLVPFVTQLTRVTTAARPCSSMSFVSEHIRGDTVLKSVTPKTAEGKRNKCFAERFLLPCCFMVLKNYPGAVAAEKWRVSGSSPGVDKIWKVFWR